MRPCPGSPVQSPDTFRRFKTVYDDDDDDDDEDDGNEPGSGDEQRRRKQQTLGLNITVPNYGGTLCGGDDEGADLDFSSDEEQGVVYRKKDTRFERNAHTGLVFSPSIPSFVNLQSTPETATPSPMVNTSSFETSTRKTEEPNSPTVYPIVKTRSMPFFRVLGVQKAESPEEEGSRKNPYVEERSRMKLDSKKSSTFGPSCTIPADMHKMATSLVSATPRPAQVSASFMTALQKPAATSPDSEQQDAPPPAVCPAPAAAAAAAAAFPAVVVPERSVNVTPPPPPQPSSQLGHARSSSSMKNPRRRHFFSSSLSSLPTPKEEKKADSDSGSSSEKEDNEPVAVSMTKMSVSVSTRNLAPIAAAPVVAKSSEMPTRDASPTPKTKIRLFNIFSPMFTRFRRRKNRRRHEKEQNEHKASKSLPAYLAPPENSVAAERAHTYPEGELRQLSLEDEGDPNHMVKTGSLPSIIDTTFKNLGATDANLERVQEQYEESGKSRSTADGTQGTSSENVTTDRDSLEARPPESEAEGAEDESRSTFDDFVDYEDLEEVADDDDDDDDDEEDEESFDPFVFMGRLERFVEAMPDYLRPAYFSYPNSVPLLARKNPNSPSHTLVLDLDETLVHCSVEPVASPDFIFPVSYDGTDFRVHAYKRPHLRAFLKSVSRMFEVVLFTASLPQYAEALTNIMDPNHEIFSFSLYRNSCVQGFGSFIKDLSLLGRDLATTVIIDNSPQAFSFQPDNGIPIRSYFDSKDDCELPKLLPFLQRLSMADDVRPLLRQRFKVSAKIEHAMTLGKPS